MSKLRKTILIVGILVVAVAASLGTALALYATGSMKTDPIELVYVIGDIEGLGKEKEYDGTPLRYDDPEKDIRLKKGSLSAGHSAIYEFIGSQTDVGTSMCDAIVKIYDENGFNVTGDYSIKVVGAPLTITPKTISVELPAQQVVYNGSKVLFNQYKISDDSEGDLCNGHKIYGSTDAALINVGDTLPEDLTPLIYDIAGNDVTKNYNIVEFRHEGIEVIKRVIAVCPESDEKVYDGTELSVNGIIFKEETALGDGRAYKLVDGHEYEFAINDGLGDKITDVDEIETQITSLKIYETAGDKRVDVTENYEFNLSEYTGSLKITPRPLTVTAKSETYVYNGEERSLRGDKEALKVEGLAERDEFVGVSYYGSITDVGKVENVIAEVTIKGLIENYDITRINGTIEVTKKELVFKTYSAEKYYDGDPLETNRASYQLVNEEQYIEIDGDGNLPSITNAGEIPNAYTVAIKDETNADVTKNYDITYEYGTLKVKVLPVKVTLKNAESDREKVNYDSKNHVPTIENASYFAVDPVLPDGEEVNFSLTYSDFDAVAETRTMCSAGEYWYTVKFKDATSEQRQKYSNYELFVPESGILEIKPLPVSVTLKEYTGDANAFTYSGKAVRIAVDDAIAGIALRNATLPSDVKIDNLLTKDDFTVIADEILDAGEDYTYTVKIADSAVAKNFDVQISGLSDKDKGVKVTVNPLPITVTLADAERTYNGYAQTVGIDETVLSLKRTSVKEGEDINDTVGLSKSDLQIVFDDEKPEPVNADKYGFTVGAIKLKAQHNYALTFEVPVAGADGSVTARDHAILTINPKKVTVTIGDTAMVYGDTALPEISFTLDCGELPNGEKLEITTALQKDGATVEYTEDDDGHILLNADDYQAVTVKKSIKGGNKSADNYEFTFDGGAFKVKPFPVAVTTGSNKRAYDGTPLIEKSVAEAEKIKLFSNHILSFPADEDMPSITDFGTKENKFEIDIMSGSDTVISNYDITYEYGTLEITKCTITLRTLNAWQPYNGRPLSATTVFIEEDALGRNFNAGLAENTELLSITNAGTVDNIFDCDIYTTDGTKVTDNFEIVYSEDCGKLTITPVNATLSLSDFTNALNVDMTYDGKVKEFTAAEAIRAITVGGVEYTVAQNKSDTEGISFAEADFIIEYSAPVKDFGKYTYTVRFADEAFAANFEIDDAQMTCAVNVRKMPVILSIVKSYTGEDAFRYDGNVKDIDLKETVSILDGKRESVDGRILSYKDLAIVCAEEFLNAGEYRYSVVIEDENLAKNFLYTVPEGDLVINKFAVNISLADYTENYSGEEFVIPANSANILTGTEATPEEQAIAATVTEEDFAFKAVGFEKIVDAGTYEYIAVIKDEEKARNFDLVIRKGADRNANIEINQLEVFVSLNDLTFTFNFEEHGIDGADALNLGADSLITAADFKFTVLKDGKETALLHSGDYTYIATLTNGNFKLANADGDKIEGGKIHIDKYNTAVTVNDLSKVYDGKEYDLSSQKNTVIIDGKEYVNTVSPIASVEDDLLSTDDIVLLYDDGESKTPLNHTNAGDYTLRAGLSAKLAEFEGDVEIEITNGKVTVNKRKITVSTLTKAFTYTGEARSAPEVGLHGAVEGHFAEADGEATENKIVKVTNVSEGSLLNKFAFRIYCTLDGIKTDVTANYEIDEANCDYGYVSVVPADITVKLNENLTAAYKGLSGDISLSGEDAIAEVDNEKFSPDDFAIVFGEEGLANVGEHAFTVVLKDDGAAANYNIVTDGKNVLNVAPLTISVGLKSYIGQTTGKEYTGKVQQASATDITALAVGGDNPDGITAASFAFTYSGDMLGVGKYSYGVKLSDELAGNYTLTFEEGEWEIVPAQITVVLQNYEKQYNGSTYTVDIRYAVTEITDFYGAKSDLIKAEDLRVKYYQELRLANNYYEQLEDGAEIAGNKYTDPATGIEYDVYTDEDTGVSYKITTDSVYKYGVELIDESVKDNFEITVEGGEFKINKRALTFMASPYYMSEQRYKEGGYASEQILEVKDYISLSPTTLLAEGDQLVIRSAMAEREDYGDTLFYLYYLADYTLTNSGCYEFTNVNGTVDAGLAVQLVIV